MLVTILRIIQYIEKIYKFGGLSPQNSYIHIFNPRGIYYYDYNSKEWRPDDAFTKFENQTVYIIEKKFQNCAGAVDEKPPSCHFKKLDYQKLFNPLHFNVEFIHIFNDWFLNDKYRNNL